MKTPFKSKVLTMLARIDRSVHAFLARASAPHVIPEFAIPISARAAAGGDLDAPPLRFASDHGRPASVAYWPSRSI